MVGTACILHRHLIPLDIERVPLWPPARGGPEQGPTVPICAESAEIVWDLLERIETHAVAWGMDTARTALLKPPARWRVSVPGTERLVAYKVWLSYGDALLRGSLAGYVDTWRADGSPRTQDFPHYRDLAQVSHWPRNLRKRIGNL